MRRAAACGSSPAQRATVRRTAVEARRKRSSVVGIPQRESAGPRAASTRVPACGLFGAPAVADMTPAEVDPIAES